MKRTGVAGCALAAASLAGCLDFAGYEGKTSHGDQQIMAGAGYTTYDEATGGCKNGTGVNCNIYLAKEDVFMSGGPEQTVSGLADGSYFFAVLAPGSQLTFLTGDGLLSTDSIEQRTFTETNHQIDTGAYVAGGGTHAIGTSPQGRPVIGLFPYSDTPNPGGVYILAICQTGATSPSQCKYDAFRVRSGDTPGPDPLFPVLNGKKYYDANINGKWDSGEPGIANWPIDYTDEVAGTVATDSNGNFTVTLIADTYTFQERLATNSYVWHQTGNTGDQSSVTGAASVSLANKIYTTTVADDSTVSGLYFGNVCLGAGGGKTLGFWSNKNGQALVGSDDLAMLTALHLRKWPYYDFDPSSKSDLRSWLLNATATNMAIMLSAQFATSELNVFNGLVSSSAIVYAPGTTSAESNGFAKLSDLFAEADATLALNGWVVDGNPERAHQEALKNAFDAANNDLNYLQAGPGTCAAPTF